MPQWFLPYTAAALVAAAVGWLALNFDPDAESPTATPTLAGAPAPGNPGAQPAPAPSSGGNAPPPAPYASAPAQSALTPDEDAVRALVTESLTTDRAADCTRFYTQAFLEQLSGDVGPEAVENCRENADSVADANSVSFEEVSWNGGAYRVAVNLEGGELAGSWFEIAAVSSAGSWKIDRLIAVDIDMPQQAEIARDGLLEDDYSDADADCVARMVLDVDETMYERAVIEGRSSQIMAGVLDKAFGCLSAEALRRELADGIRAGAGDAPEALIQCVIDQIVGGKSAAELRALIQMDHGAGFEMGREAGIECARSMNAAFNGAAS